MTKSTLDDAREWLLALASVRKAEDDRAPLAREIVAIDPIVEGGANQGV